MPTLSIFVEACLWQSNPPSSVAMHLKLSSGSRNLGHAAPHFVSSRCAPVWLHAHSGASCSAATSLFACSVGLMYSVEWSLSCGVPAGAHPKRAVARNWQQLRPVQERPLSAAEAAADAPAAAATAAQLCAGASGRQAPLYTLAAVLSGILSLRSSCVYNCRLGSCVTGVVSQTCLTVYSCHAEFLILQAGA